MAEMKSRERVIRAIEHQETDRTPIDIGGLSNITTMHKDAYRKMQKYLGHEGEPFEISSMLSQSAKPDEYVRKRFKADCYPIYSSGPEGYMKILQTDPVDGSTFYYDDFQVKWACPKNGFFYDPVGHPLAEMKTIDEMEAFDWPDPYDKTNINGQGIVGLGDKAKDLYENTDYALVVGGIFNGGTFVPIEQLLGYEKFFKMLMKKPDTVRYLLDKILTYEKAHWDMLLDEVGKYASVAVLSDDLGSQIAPIMRPSIYRDVIKPYHKEIVNFIKSKCDHIKIVYHCDGAISEFLPDMLDIGYDAWNPVQFSANGMDDTAAINREYGDKIAFWGGTCDAQGVLSRGTVEEVKEDVKRRIKDLAPGSGLVLASVHNIQREVPIENMVALYDSFYEYGTAFMQGKL